MTSTWRKLLRCAGAVLVLSLLAAAGSQEQGADRPGQRGLISLKFAGGTASDYVATVRRAAGNLNVVIAPEAAEVPMPEVELKEVTPSAALDLLGGLALVRPDREVRLHVVHVSAYDPRERPTYQITASVIGRSAHSRAHVWTVSNLLDHDIPSKAVLAAVEMALDVVGSPTKMDVRFHEDTGLLIATGDGGQIEVIDEVISQLNDSVAERLENPIHELNAALELADAKHVQAVARLMETEQSRKIAQDHVLALEVELQRVEMRASELERMLDRTQRELDRVTSELHALELKWRGQRRREGPGGNPDD